VTRITGGVDVKCIDRFIQTPEENKPLWNI